MDFVVCIVISSPSNRSEFSDAMGCLRRGATRLCTRTTVAIDKQHGEITLLFGSTQIAQRLPSISIT